MNIKWEDYYKDIQHVGSVLNPDLLPKPNISYNSNYSREITFESPELVFWMESQRIKTMRDINDPLMVNNYILTYKFPDEKNVYLVGDLHGNYKRFKEELLERDYHDCIFIMLGDQVMLYDDSWRQYRKLDNIFRERNCEAYFIRGNHDCAYFHTQEY